MNQSAEAPPFPVLDIAGGPPAPWGLLRITLYFVLIGLAWIGAQSAVIFGVVFAQTVRAPTSDAGAALVALDGNGIVLVVATLAGAVVCIPLTWRLTRRRDAAARSTLGLRRVSIRSIAAWTAATAAVTLGLGAVIDIPAQEYLVRAFMTTHPALLFLAIVVAAPLLEEVVFRGFLIGALRSAGIPSVWAVVATSLLWTVVHMQYQLEFMSVIFVIGLLLGAARIRTASLVPCLVMHAANNAMAFVEMSFV